MMKYNMMETSNCECWCENPAINIDNTLYYATDESSSLDN